MQSETPNPKSSEANSAAGAWANMREDEFPGERNINDKTGKERTRSIFDIYPKMKGETSEDYGRRLRGNRQKINEYQAAERAKAEAAQIEADKKAYVESEFGKGESAAEAKYDRMAEKLEALVSAGKITQERANALLERQLDLSVDEINGYRQDWEDRKSVGTAEEEAAYKDWLEKRDVANQENLAKREAEERAKLEEEKRKQLENEEREKAEEELKAEEAELAKKQEELAQVEKELSPLAAINADFTYDKKELARDLAEKQLNADNAKANLIKRIWKGTYFKKYYQKKYEREILEGTRTFGVDANGDAITIDDLIKERSSDAIHRFVLGATEDLDYIHKKAGENLSEADKEVTAAVRAAIEKYASAKETEGVSQEDLKREFENDIRRISAEKRDQGQPVNEKLIDNYFEVAVMARERIEQDIAMEKVMEGFKVYNAEVRDGVRTEAHRDNIDKIVDRFENGKIGQFIPAEVIAGALGCAYALTRTGTRAIVGAGGGLGVAGVLAGLRERNRVTEDRARMIRDRANSEQYDGSLSKHPEGKREKYEAKIGGTVYELTPANELAADIQQAKEGGDSEEILWAIAKARVKIDFSDSEQKDLISYSSADKRGDERTKLDIAVIRAEKSLSDADKEKLNTIKEKIRKSIIDYVDEKDKDFRKVRTAMALKQAGKTIAVGATVFVVSQEIMALARPVFERAGIIKASNIPNQEETLLARGLGLAQGRYESVSTNINDVISKQSYIVDDVTLNGGDPRIDDLRADGYIINQISPASPSVGPQLVDVAPADSPSRLDVIYDGWADNGTQPSDGNELRLLLEDGQFVSNMSGTSTMGNQVFDYNNLASVGQIKGYVTVGGAKFELASSVNELGQLTWGKDGVLTTTTGETLKVIGDNGEKLYQYLEVAVDNGVDADGVTHIIPLATDVGSNSFSDTIRQVIDVPTEEPGVFQCTKIVTVEYPLLDTSGIVAPIAGRTGLGETRPTVNTTSSTSEPTPEPAPEPTPEPASEPTTPPETDSPSEANTAEQISRYKEDLNNRLGNLIGETGIDLLSKEGDLSDDDMVRAASWWRNLDERGRAATINEITRQSNDLGLGTGLRRWLQNVGQIL